MKSLQNPRATRHTGLFDLAIDDGVQPTEADISLLGNLWERDGGRLKAGQEVGVGVHGYADYCNILHKVKSDNSNMPQVGRATVCSMMRKTSRRATAEQFRANLKLAMDFHGLKPADLVKASGVSLRMIYAVLRGENRPTVDVAEALGRAVGYTGWELLLPTFTPSHRVNEVVAAYGAADDNGRAIMDAIAKRELPEKKAS